MWGEMNIHKQEKKELWSAPYALYKITSKWILDLNIKHKPIKQLEKNKRENLCDTTLSYKLLDTKLKARSIKKLISETLSEIKRFALQKTLKKMKRKAMH